MKVQWGHELCDVLGIDAINPFLQRQDDQLTLRRQRGAGVLMIAGHFHTSTGRYAHLLQSAIPAQERPTKSNVQIGSQHTPLIVKSSLHCQKHPTSSLWLYKPASHVLMVLAYKKSRQHIKAYSI
jgi:hypothetical protein